MRKGAHKSRKPIRPSGEDPVHICVQDLCKSYGPQQVLQSISCDIQRGAITVIIGGSGAGKSTLMRQLVRLEKPDSGRIIVNGRNIVHLNEAQLLPVRRKFGMVFQMSALFDSMTVYENLAFPLREHTRLRPRQIREKVMDKLSILGVDHSYKKYPSEISGGMNKRVAVARALMLEPEVLIYDEPTSGLDPITSRTVDELIVDTQRRTGVTSIVVSHDMASVFNIADQVCYLHQGRIELQGDPHRFLKSASEHVRDFLQSSGIDPAMLNERYSEPPPG